MPCPFPCTRVQAHRHRGTKLKNSDRVTKRQSFNKPENVILSRRDPFGIRIFVHLALRDFFNAEIAEFAKKRTF
jgi:hypothetical protein